MNVGTARIGCAAAAVASLCLTACSGGHEQRPAAEAATAASRPTASSPSLPAAASSAPRTTTTTGAVNLTAGPRLKVELRNAYIRALHHVRGDETLQHVRSIEISGPRLGTVYYAYYPKTKTYWAIAWFDPSPQARHQTQVELQDGMTGAIFTRRVNSASWSAAVRERQNLPYPAELPDAVLHAWAIQPQSCGM